MCLSNSVREPELNRCKSGCDPTSLVLIRVGWKEADTYVAQCCTCQHATPVLPKQQAIAEWNKANS